MNREDIIRMARDSGMELYGLGKDREKFVYYLREFATLVAAAERNKLAQWMIDRGYATGHGDTVEDLLQELEWQVKDRVGAEREACAKVAEQELGNTASLTSMPPKSSAAWNILQAIRARGETK